MTTNNDDTKKEVLGITLKDSKNNGLSDKKHPFRITPNHPQTNSDNINVANNVAQRNSQDLTEQYQIGTLPCGFYYFDNGIEQYIVDYRSIAGVKKGVKGVSVISPVPSYEQWQQMKAFCEEFNALNVAEENQKLKELLKEWIHYYPIILYEYEDTLKTKDIVELFDKTREALK